MATGTASGLGVCFRRRLRGWIRRASHLPVDPLDPRTVPGDAFDVAQRESTRPPILIGVRQASQPSGDCMRVLVTAGRITITALAHAKGATRMANPCLAPLERRQSERAAPAGPSHFFAMASLSQSARRCA